MHFARSPQGTQFVLLPMNLIACFPLIQHVPAFPVEPLAGRADAEAFAGLNVKSFGWYDALPVEFLCQLFLELLLVPVGFRKPGIALPEFIVRHVCVDAFLHQLLHVLFGVESAVRSELGFLEYVFFLARWPRSFPGFLRPWVPAARLRFAERLGMDHDLVFAVHHGDAVVSLDHAMGGLHRGAFVVGDVALSGFTPLPGLSSLSVSQFLIFFTFSRRVAAYCSSFSITALSVSDLSISRCLVTISRDGFFHLFFFMRQVFLGPAPFLRGVRGELASVHGEHLFADQAHLVADEQHFEEELDCFLVLGGDEVGDGGEVRPGIGGQGHEDDVFVAAVSYLPAGSDPFGIGVEDDL